MRPQKDSPRSPWGPEKKLQWFAAQRVQRSYHDDVLVRIEALKKSGGPSFLVESYGNLSIDPERFPLYAARVGNRPGLKTVLITGGVHGYETSGVKGALLFLEEYATTYTQDFNFVVAPCVSPWSYETVNRLDPIMENPNREFKKEGESKAEESRLLMRYLLGLGIEFDAHIDLHETTDSDRVFLPEEYAKNGQELHAEDIDIPDGFYLLGQKPRFDLEKAMMAAVRQVTHIAAPNAQGKILDIPLSHEGVVHGIIPNICASFTSADSRLGAYTTEMYPDSPRFAPLGRAAADAVCNEAQVACVRGALDFWKKA